MDINVIMSGGMLGYAVRLDVYVHRNNDGDDDMKGEREASYKILGFIVCLMVAHILETFA